MANNLHRNLTGYSAIPVVCDHPAVPRSGDPVRLGKLVGIALINEQYGYGPGGYRRPIGNIYMSPPADVANNRRAEDGTTPVTFQMNEWRVTIKNADTSAVAPAGTEVWYVDAGEDGTTLVANPTGTKAAFAGYIMEQLAADEKKADAVLLLVNGGFVDLS